MTGPGTDPGQSHVNHSACLWEPQEREITLSPAAETADYPEVFPYDGFWYLYLCRGVSIGLGRHPASVASDAAAMRKLAAVAAEAAEELERRAAEQEQQQ